MLQFQLSELIDAEAPPIPAFDDEKPVFKSAQKKFRLDGLMDILRHESRAENTTRVVKGFAMAAMTGIKQSRIFISNVSLIYE